MSRTVLFDLDGTLTDPKIGITRCIAYALGKLGHPEPTLDSLCWCIGPPLADSFGTILETDDPARKQEAVALYRERFGTVGLFENELYAGIPECLAALKADGYRLFVATSKPTFYAKQITAHFGLSGWFDAEYGSELDGTRSNKGDLIRHILETERLDAAKTIMIGDRKHDILGARNNNVPGIGVLYGYGSHDELTAVAPFAVCEKVGDLFPTIQRAFQ